MTPARKIDDRKVRTNFSAHADMYDQFARVQKRVIDALCARIETSGCLQGPVLDIGSGTGSLAEKLCASLPRERVTVMDIAHGMTCRAARRLPGVMACDGDAARLPFRDRTFRSVVSSSVYQWVPRLPDAFSEARRVLRPGGLFAVALFGERTLFELRSAHRHAMAACRRSTASHVQSFPARAEVADALRDAGFACREMVAYPEVDYHDSVARLLRELKRIGAANASGQRPTGLASRQVMQSMMAYYENVYREERGLPATYEVVLFLAVKR